MREDAIVAAVDTWLPTLADATWLASTQESDTLVEAQHARLHAQLAEIDKAAGNLVSAIEAGLR